MGSLRKISFGSTQAVRLEIERVFASRLELLVASGGDNRRNTMHPAELARARRCRATYRRRARTGRAAHAPAGVGAAAAFDLVVVVTAQEHVRAVAADHRIEAELTVKLVIANPAGEFVVAGVAEQHIVSEPAFELIVAESVNSK